MFRHIEFPIGQEDGIIGAYYIESNGYIHYIDLLTGNGDIHYIDLFTGNADGKGCSEPIYYLGKEIS